MTEIERMRPAPPRRRGLLLQDSVIRDRGGEEEEGGEDEEGEWGGVKRSGEGARRGTRKGGPG
ncbi:hypothetical protein GCM10025874_18780 [Arenivirga flava]|uniref:Uncharacterized protein n=1 Tax=Arenivirga flava TaxID=1930060 RepID=A0AA37UL16_9MICO|nr:hypothetical protein GCM10025874_18780 [Arenivirga flava]